MNAKTSEATIARLHDRLDAMDDKVFNLEMLVSSLKQSNDLMHRLILQTPATVNPPLGVLAEPTATSAVVAPSNIPFANFGAFGAAAAAPLTPQSGGPRHRWTSTV